MKTMKIIINRILTVAALALLAFTTACLNPPRNNAADRWGESYDSMYTADAISSFVFTAAANSTVFSTDIDSVIGEETITVYVPYGTDTRSLVASFETGGISVTVNGVEQKSGLTSNSFSGPVIYTVTALDASEHTYTVNFLEVTVQTFAINYPLPGGGTGAAAGSINHAAGTITVALPYSNSSLAGLSASYVVPPGITADVDGVAQSSGVTVNDYTGSTVDPVSWVVTSPTGVSATYSVTADIGSLNVGHFAGPFGGAGAVDGTGSAARFYRPRGRATDVTNLYVVDSENHIIRKIVIATGAVTTLAGLAGSPGSSDGTGSAARFSTPVGIATNGVYLYVTDSLNHTVRKVVIATGTVTTLAGTAGSSGSSDGTGSAAQFDQPQGVATDGVNLYVSDTHNHTIRKIVISSGAVTTIAGLADANGWADDPDGPGSDARFFSPRGLATDGENLYVADAYNHTIRKIVISSGAVTTLAGLHGTPGSIDDTGTNARFNRPFHVATDGVNLYVSDTDNHAIRKIVIATGAVTTLAGTALAYEPYGADDTGSSARFYHPRGIATDGVNLYVSDQDNHTIRRIVIALRLVSTLAGMATSIGSDDGIESAARFNAPRGTATDGDNLYVVDYNNHTIRKIVIATGEVSTVAGAAGISGSDDDLDGPGTDARFNLPNGIATDGDNLYVTDGANHTIRKIVLNSGIVTTLAGLAGNHGSDDGMGSTARFYYPFGIIIHTTNLYVADGWNHTIRKIVIATGEVSTMAGDATQLPGSDNGTGSAARFNFPRGLTADGANLYVTDSENHTIRKIVIATGEVSTPAGLPLNSGTADGTGSVARFNYPLGITTDGVNLYVSDTDNHTIRKVVIATGAVTTIAGMAGIPGSIDGVGTNSSFNGPVGISLVDGKLYVADRYNHRIRILWQ